LETMRAREKLVMFDQCVPEIEMLIYVSVLTHFYDSDEFKQINGPRELLALERLPTEDVAASISLRGYAKRMPSLYDVVSKTQQNRIDHSHLFATGNSTAVQYKAEASMNCLSPDYTKSSLTENSKGLLSPFSPGNTVQGIRPYHRKTATNNKAQETAPILVNPSHSTESVFAFEFDGSTGTLDGRYPVKERSSSATVTMMEKHRAKKKNPQKMRRRRTRSISNSPSSTHKSTHLLSPSISTVIMDRFHPLSHGLSFAVKEEKDTIPMK